MNNILIKSYRFTDYPISIIKSKSIRPIYYTEDNILKKHHNKLGVDYDFDDKGRLIDLWSQELVLKNKKTAFKERHLTIDGSKLHQLTERTYDRSKILAIIKEWCLKHIKNQGVISKEYERNKIYFEFIFYTGDYILNNPSNKKRDVITDEDGLKDTDNHSIYYTKIIMDCFNHQFRNAFGERVNNSLGFLISDNYLIVKKFSVEHKEVERNDRHDIMLKVYKM
jgi:hypothetical protein